MMRLWVRQGCLTHMIQPEKKAGKLSRFAHNFPEPLIQTHKHHHL